VKGLFFRHFVSLFCKIADAEKSKEPRSITPMPTDIGAFETRFHPNLLLHLSDC